MAKKLDDVMAALPKDRQERVQARAKELATLKHPASTIEFRKRSRQRPVKRGGAVY